MAIIINKSQKPINLAGVVILPTQTEEVNDSTLKLPTVDALIKKGFLEVSKKPESKTSKKAQAKADEQTNENAEVTE